MISQTRWCSPRSPVEPMYIPGRLRTASRPSSTVIADASYATPLGGSGAGWVGTDGESGWGTSGSSDSSITRTSSSGPGPPRVERRAGDHMEPAAAGKHATVDVHDSRLRPAFH